MVGPLGQYRPGFLQTEPSSSFPAAFPVEIEWGLGNELLICAPAASVAASDGAFQGRSDDRHDDVAGRGSAIVSVTWADTSSFHRQIAAGASSLYGRLQAAIAAEMAEEAEDAEIDERRERWRHVSRWSRHVSRLLSPPSSQSTLAAARASPHSLGISAADPFAAIDVEEREEWGDEPTNQSLPRGITQGELAAVWDLLRLCFLPHHTPGSADVDNDMDTRMGGSADVDSAFRGARGVGGIRGMEAGGRGGSNSSFRSSPPSSYPLLLPPPSAAPSTPTCQPFVSWLAQYNASLPPCNTSTSACLRSLRDQMSQSEAIPPEVLEPYWPAVASCAAMGWRDTATALLRCHSSYREDQVIQREAENGLVEAVAVLLAEMPMPLEPMAAHDAAEVSAYYRHRDHWRNRLARLKASPFWAAADAPATERALLALLDLLLGSSRAVDDVARSHWLELLGARLLHQNPQATAAVQASLALQCWREAAAGGGGKSGGASQPLDASDLIQPSLDRLMLASLCRETEVVVSIASRLLPSWFLVQVIELLSLPSPSLSALPAKQAAAAVAQNAASAAREPSTADGADISGLSVLDLCRVNYAMDLLSDAATWQLALPYLAPCPPGEPFIEQALLCQPVTVTTHTSISKTLFLLDSYAPACYPSAAAFLSRSAAMACWDSRSLATSRHVASVYWMAAAGAPAAAPMDALVLFLADELLVPAIRGRLHLVQGAPGSGSGGAKEGATAGAARAAAALDALRNSSGSTGQSHSALEYVLSVWELVKELTGGSNSPVSPFFPATTATATPEPIQRSHQADRLVQAMLHTSSHYPRVFLSLSHLMAHVLQNCSLPFKEAHISALISCLQHFSPDSLSQQRSGFKNAPTLTARSLPDADSQGGMGQASLWDHLNSLKLALAKELSAKIMFL
ncbi:unnamed protein product [Closterium sp. Naga37s-1]|nr:unnamed protein product [Closterium sp. Naga37s-1]